jgi:signal transduction histidine kinase/ligand-binding sensor domain-containing protein/DNA-binding response OmpR family regulator
MRVSAIIFSLFISVSALASNDIYFSKIGIENGLSQLSVVSIYQDETGYLWFGTREGVNLYNGNRIRIFRPVADDKNSLLGSLVKNICGDKNGTVFIHTQNGVNAYNLRTEKMSVVERRQVDAIAWGTRNLWLASGNNLYGYANGKEFRYLTLPSPKSEIRVVMQASDQRIFIGTLASGLIVADQNKRLRTLISGCSQISTIFEDSHKNIWVGTWQDGLFKIARNGTITNYNSRNSNKGQAPSSDFIRAICEDDNGFIWIGTKKGIDRFDGNAIFKHYGSDEYNNRQLSNESVWSLLRDNQGTIWVGSYFGGVNYFNPNIDYYTFHDLQQGSQRNKPFPVISEIVEDKFHNLFLCTEGNGLIYYNPAERTYRSFRADEHSPNSLSGDNIKTSYFDKTSNLLWLGIHLGGLCCLNLNNWQFKQYKTIRPEWDQSDIVRAIVPFQNKLLIATYNGVFTFDPGTGLFSLFSEKLHKYVHYCVDAKIDNSGHLWIASRGVFRFDLKTGKCQSYSYNEKDSTSLSNNNAVKILIDKKQRVWIATSGGGVNLYNDRTNSFKRFDARNSGLKNDYISNLIESRNGNIIIATTQGFSMLDTKRLKIHNYDIGNGLPLNSLYNGGMCLTESGELFLAGMNGMVSFYEEKLSVPTRPFMINLVSLWVNNKPVVPGDETGILESALPYTNSIGLSYKQSMITIEFASNNYIPTNQPIYRYRLEGLSNSWTELPQGVLNLNFMNLSSGKYRLEVEGLSPADGKVMAHTSLDIKVFPPIYRTWYAYLFYIALIIFIVWRYSVFSRDKLLLKTSLEYEKKEKAHLEEVNQSKLRFFTNISHEFRTPLTLIMGQLDMLMQTHNVAPPVYNRILSIKRHTLNMQNLINELLEFRKSEQERPKVKVSEHDLVKFLYEIYLSFSEYAAYRQISFDFECKDDVILMWFDPSQLQKAFYNLISNAFKYTRKEGRITISIEQAEQEVIIRITDNGIGISAEAIEKIFDRFYQAENGLQISNMSPGTGIGLALTKNILELHSATVKVTSQLQEGSCFTVRMKKGSAHFTEEQMAETEDIDRLCLTQMDELDSRFMQEVISTQVAGNEPLYSMLIVEDNDDLRNMLQTIFEPIYKIYTAADGEEGLQMTIRHEPDIVLSDVMMPKLSGSEMCSRIKNNFNICHIPVVLLTALSSVEYNIEGLRLGADDYVTKPFNVKTLITRCNNLVNGRKLLQEKFSRQTDFAPRQIATNNLDREFLEKAQRIIEENIDNPEFDVPAFSREMALGRTKLFGKIKGITGQTPNDFIMTIKLKKAADLLNNHPEYNISDITYMLGFSSPKYFTKCFKEQFGLSPSAFRKMEEPQDDTEDTNI